MSQNQMECVEELTTQVEGLLRQYVQDDEAGEFFKAFATLLSRLEGKRHIAVEYDVEVESKTTSASMTSPSVWKSTVDLLQLLNPSRYWGGTSAAKKTVLKAKGKLEPGRFTLLLGPAGSGKSMLLRALSGRIESSRQKSYQVTGGIKFQGKTCSIQEGVDLFTWVRQSDVHEPLLTVGETSEFATRCTANQVINFILNETRDEIGKDVTEHAESGGVGTAGMYERIEKVLNDNSNLWAHIMLNILGIGGSFDTMVGGQMVRGISGGQRRRLSIVEGLVGFRNVIMLDEINTGLDSATTFDVITALRFICKMTNATMLVSLLQPQAEVFNLFDDVIFLESGRVLYHGPKDSITPFFQSFGFQKMPGIDPATFFSELCNPVGQILAATPSLLEKHGISSAQEYLEGIVRAADVKFLVHPSEMEEAFWLSGQAGIDKETFTGEVADDFPKHEASQHGNGQLKQCSIILWRQWKIESRQRASLIIRLIQIITLGIIYGTLFSISPSPDGGRSVISLATTSSLGLFFLSMVQIPITLHAKPVFFKHIFAGFYRPWTYIVSTFIPQICIQGAESMIFSLLVYFMAGYYRSVGYFFTYFICLWSTLVATSSIYRMLAFLVRGIVVCNGIASLISLLAIITGGFVIIKENIPSYMIWIYWMNPISWNVRCLSINEMTSPPWNEVVPNGEDQLALFDIYTDRSWIWKGLGFLWGSSIFYAMMTSIFVRYRYPLASKPVIEEDQALDQREEEPGFLAKKSSSLTISGGSCRDMVQNPVALFCKDISYSVMATTRDPQDGAYTQKELTLLNSISFYALPGKSTALMGGSGAGKTTLMDVVLDRKTQGKVTGERYINGEPLDKSTWPNLHGYVEQFDLLNPFLTVREAVSFSASLRIDKKTKSSLFHTFVSRSLDIVDLCNIQNRVIGQPIDGLSLEQRKRTSIAIELVAQPSVIFMDEPTSGLSVTAAHVVAQTIKKVASTGRTVVVTIHQPSIAIFESFDQLLLLHKGGVVDYFGPIGDSCKDVINYISGYPGVKRLEDGYNPASWILEVTGAAKATVFGSSSVNFAEEYVKSQIYENNLSTMERLMREYSANQDSATRKAEKYTSSAYDQVVYLLIRFTKSYWRNSEYNFTRIFISMIIAAIYSITFLNLASISGVASENEILSVVGFLFSVANFSGVFTALGVQGCTKLEMDLYQRERASNYYSIFPWLFSSTLIELPWLFIQAVVLIVITYWSVGFDSVPWKFFYFLLVMYLNILSYCFMGQLFVYATPNLILSQMITSNVCQLFAIFSGFLAPYATAPSGWKWMLRITPTYWTVYGLSTAQYRGSESLVRTSVNTTISVSDYLETAYGYNESMMWWVPLILLAYCISSKLLSFMALTFLRFTKR